MELPRNGRDFDTLLVTVDANEAAIGLYDGENIRIIWEDNSMVPKKHRKGGQSQRRFERDRERALQSWLRHVVEQVSLASDNCPTIKNIIVGGPGMTKDLFVKEMPRRLTDRLTDVRHCGYTDENGLWEIVGTSRYI